MSIPAAFVLTLVWAVGAQLPGSSSVDWAVVPTGTQAPHSLNNPLLGTCICDLHGESCDPNCCCDGDCSADDKGAFLECKQEVVSTKRFRYCYDDNPATRIVRDNVGDGVYRDETIPGESAVCLVRSNYPSGLDAYFVQPQIVGASDFVEKSGTDWFNTPANSAGFKVGDRIPLVFAQQDGESWRIVTKASGFLTIPRPSSFGLCSYDSQVGFMEPSSKSSCVLNGTIESLCLSQLSAQLLTFSAVTLPEHVFLDSRSLVPIVVTFVDRGGQLLSTFDPTATFESILAQVPTQSPQNSTNTSSRHRRESTKLQTSLSDCRCTNAVIAVNYTFFYNVSAKFGRVVNATLQLTLDDITKSNCSAKVNVLRETVVTFRKLGSNSNPTTRIGNPGYKVGAPVLAGTLLSNGDKSVVQVRSNGFAIPVGPSCLTGRTKPVKFLHSVKNAGCYVDLLESDLVAMCAAPSLNNDLLLRVLTSQGLYNSSFDNNTVPLVDRVAKVGDAETNAPWQWVNLLGMPWATASATPYDSLRRKCTSLITGLQYTFLVNRAGAEYNPQDVIVGAKVTPMRGAWTFRNSSSDSADSTTRVYFKFSVSFVRYNEGSSATKMRRAVPPAILPEMDDDFFYPFRMPN